MFNSEKMSSQEFVERLNSGNLNPESMIFGKVKKSENDSEVLFAFKGDKSNWIKIPADKIDHVHLIKSFSCEGQKMALVKLHLKKPANDEAKLFHDLLSALQEKVMKWHRKKMMMCGCGSGEMNPGEKGRYDHHSCNWNQYKK